MLIVGKLLSLLGAVLLAWPALHVLLASRAYDQLLEKAKKKQQLVWLAEQTRSDFLVRFGMVRANLFLFLTVSGIIAVLAGFLLDFIHTLANHS